MWFVLIHRLNEMGVLLYEHIHIYTLEFWKAPFRHHSEFGVSIKISICRIAVESHQISPLHWDWNWSNRKMESQQTASVDLNSSKRSKSPIFISIFSIFSLQNCSYCWLLSACRSRLFVPKAIMSNWVCHTDKSLTAQQFLHKAPH